MPLNFKPKLDKTVELLLYLAGRLPGADKYQAVKFLYLADREHLARFGRPITYDNYYALWYGPVASKALDLIEGDKWVLREASIDRLPLKTTVGKAPNGKNTIFLSDPEREVNLNLLSKSDIRVFDEIVEKYKDYSFKQLMDLTHEHEAYKEAWAKRRDGGERAPMYYEEMIEDKAKREALIDNLEPVAAHM
ncbi:Panacea domain-containing protein [Rhodopseudomonas palustris]|uniref:Panacea domain-containing protein n=1 Tax=Rhodopseudomonas palustris TaxID=1076 RepID=UPI0020CF87FE|nr:Panacea domain-containing protein [Rhodopseudomonas palustris]MCP9629227.1 Panacea domain-containing protein [Rhodopseudomonas palustris]